jgi:hypothetical protein
MVSGTEGKKRVDEFTVVMRMALMLGMAAACTATLFYE